MVSEFGGFRFPKKKKFDTLELLKVQKDCPLNFYFKRYWLYLLSKISPVDFAVSPFIQTIFFLFSFRLLKTSIN
jgi:hypothetical protein